MASEKSPASIHSFIRTWLPFSMIFLAVGLLSASVSTYLKSQPPAPNPLALHPPTLIVEGTFIKPGDSMKPVEFSLVNHGEVPLGILGIESTCSCTTVDTFNAITLAPGESKSVALKVRIPSFGEKESSLRIQTDYAAQPIKTLPIRAIGLPPDKPFVVAKDHSLSVSGSQPGESTSTIFEITTIELEDAPEAWITGAKSTSPLSSVNVESRTVEEILADGRNRCVYRMQLKTSVPEANEKQRNERLSLETRGEGLVASPQWTVQVFLTPKIQAYPSRVHRVVPQDGQNPSKATVILKAESGCVIERIDIDQPWVEAKLLQPTDEVSSMQKIEFHFDLSKRPEEKNETTCVAKVHLKNPENMTLDIPVSLSVDQ